MADSEDMVSNIDSGTAVSIEFANSASLPSAQLLLAARRRRQRLALESTNEISQRKRSALNAFGDSEDEGGDDDEDGGDEDTDNVIGPEGGLRGLTASSGTVDLFRLRQAQRHVVK